MKKSVTNDIISSGGIVRKKVRENLTTDLNKIEELNVYLSHITFFQVKIRSVIVKILNIIFISL